MPPVISPTVRKSQPIFTARRFISSSTFSEGSRS